MPVTNFLCSIFCNIHYKRPLLPLTTVFIGRNFSFSSFSNIVIGFRKNMTSLIRKFFGACYFVTTKSCSSTCDFFPLQALFLFNRGITRGRIKLHVMKLLYMQCRKSYKISSRKSSERNFGNKSKPLQSS